MKALIIIFSLQVLLTPRNIFIANLTLSNLLLCVFTMPLTLADLTTKYWPLGGDMVIFTLMLPLCKSCLPKVLCAN